MQNIRNDLLGNVASYYAQKLSQYGDTPRGVDWNGEDSQVTRFAQLCKVIDVQKASFSVNDLGCGYGALLDYMQPRYPKFRYLGVDISTEMIKAAERRHAVDHQVRFVTAAEPDEINDYGVASGIFNVCVGQMEAAWFAYLQATLDVLDRTSRYGFAFNCLTSYSDDDKKRSDLYYADPCLLFDLCKRRYSLQVALLHDYGLYEFTILVRK